jgi:hypothetical protein
LLLQELARNRSVAAAIKPRFTFAGAQYATGGVGLRNRAMGAMQISGAIAPVKKAYLYFAYLYSAAPPAKQIVEFCSPDAASPATFACKQVATALLAKGADPCWRSNGIAIYDADVTAMVAGNGEYQIKVTNAISAETDGKDPWTSVILPAAEGASLVVVGTGASNVAIYDSGLAGITFQGNTSYTLAVPGGVAHLPVLWDNIGADGQLGDSRAAGLGKEETLINTVQIAGPGVNVSTGVTDSDWDGSSGWPLPQLWDDTGHSLPSSAATTGTTSLAVSIVSPATASNDCLTTVANVISY